MASARFKADKGIMDALAHPRKKRGAGGQEEATVGETVLATPLACFMLTMPEDRLVITRAAEEDDGGDCGRVRSVWPHRVGGQD